MERIASRGGRVVRGRCLPYRERSAYGAFASQVKELAGIFDSDDVDVATGKLRTLVERLVGTEEAEAVAGHLAILLGFETKTTTPDRDSLFQSVRVFIEAGARDEATAFVFEDIHWADPALLDLIELLAARLHDLPVLLLTLSRPELLDARPAWGGGLLAYNALPLEPLTGGDAAQLALHLLGADTKAAQVAQAAEGNPLFIEQLAAVMSESGAPAETLPGTIRGLVSARLDALPAEEREVILDASIVGRIFWRGALERIARDPDCLGGSPRRARAARPGPPRCGLPDRGRRAVVVQARPHPRRRVRPPAARPPARGPPPHRRVHRGSRRPRSARPARRSPATGAAPASSSTPSSTSSRRPRRRSAAGRSSTRSRCTRRRST